MYSLHVCACVVDIGWPCYVFSVVLRIIHTLNGSIGCAHFEKVYTGSVFLSLHCLKLPHSMSRAHSLCFSPRGHKHALLEQRVHSERRVEVAGISLQPPEIVVHPAADSAGRRITLKTVYGHAGVEVWYSVDGTVPERGVSRRWKGDSIPIDDDVTALKASAYFFTAVASPVAQVLEGVFSRRFHSTMAIPGSTATAAQCFSVDHSCINTLSMCCHGQCLTTCTTIMHSGR